MINDDVILFPITSETFGTGSLAETGFSILSAIKSNNKRFVIIFIDDNVNPLLQLENPTASKESKNSRAIIKSHLSKIDYDNVFIVDSLNRMLELSIKLYKISESLIEIKKEYS